MKNKTLLIIPVLVLLVIPFSCKKFIQKQEQNALIQLVTNGTWRITGYMDHQVINLTDSFAGYSFQFNQN
jgi:competence protein ComGC